jgi:hypothetical protein
MQLRRMMIVLPPKSDLPVDTVHAIYKQAGWQKE